MAHVDLQMHSTFSDGLLTPTALVEMAAAQGVKLMALTDHDGTNGTAETVEAGARLGVRVISGIELTTARSEQTLHILGYQFDPYHPKLQAFCEYMMTDRKRVFVEKLTLINARLQSEKRKTIDLDAYIATQQGFFGLGKALNFMVRSGVMASKDEAVKYWEQSSKVRLTTVMPEEAIAVLHAAGGIAVLSHPLAPKLSLKKITLDQVEQKKIVARFVAAGLDGIECYGSNHSEEDKALAAGWAREFGLLITAGSDWHGPIEKLGEQIRTYIPYYVEKVGDVVVPDDVAQKLLTRFAV